jgi:hypothetical protein
VNARANTGEAIRRGSAQRAAVLRSQSPQAVSKQLIPAAKLVGYGALTPEIRVGPGGPLSDLR